METERSYKRSNLRLVLGSQYFIFKRYLKWVFESTKYAVKYDYSPLEHKIFTHKTPLVRKLKDVDMWMQKNKIINVRNAVKKIDGVIINPGETLSYWKLLGKVTKRRGYVEGMVLSNGKIKPGVGGGLCQLSNLIYWMTLHTPLTVVERYRHNYDYFPDADRTQPFGSGATCAYNYIDLQIKNETNEPFQLHVYLNEDYLVGEWRSTRQIETTYEIYEKDHIITHEFWGDYVRHNTLYRKVFDLCGHQVNDEFITENHAIMVYSPLLKPA